MLDEGSYRPNVVVTGARLFPIEISVEFQQTLVSHEEAAVTMTYPIIQEVAVEKSHVAIVSDGTDVLCILAHHLQKRIGGMHKGIELTMKRCSKGLNAIYEVIK